MVWDLCVDSCAFPILEDVGLLEKEIECAHNITGACNYGWCFSNASDNCIKDFVRE